MSAKVSMLERMMSSPDVFGLTTITPVQRAICRCSDGVDLGELWEDPNVREAFGGAKPPAVPPKTLVILAGIRGGKSLFAAAKSFETALTCDVSGLRPGDILRIPVLSIDKRGARQIFSHLVGTIQANPKLRAHLIGEPTAENVLIRHQSGRSVEVSITAMSAQGGSLVGNWLAGCCFDEAPRMAGSSDGVRNLDDSLHAIGGRMRPGSQTLIVGSPNIPFGPVYDMAQEHFGKPSAQIVIVRATGPLLNPVWWTPERCEEMRRDKPRVYVTDVLGKFADAEDQLIASSYVDKAMRKAPAVIAPVPGHNYVAAIDPAMRGNAWTLVVLGCDGLTIKGEPIYYVAMAKQWKGSKSSPLRPDLVFREIARDLKPYNLKEFWTDGHQVDSLTVIAEQEGLELNESFTTQDDNTARMENIRVLLETERLQLSPDRTMRADLLRMKRKVNQKTTRIDLPVTSDGRHCDYVPALGLCLTYPPTVPTIPRLEQDPGLAAALAAVDARNDRNNLARSVFLGGLNG